MKATETKLFKFLQKSAHFIGSVVYVERVFNQFLARQFDDVNSRDLGGVAKL